MWRHDRSSQRPVNRGHEPFCTSAHVEGAAEQSHSDSYLLAWKPGVGFEVSFESDCLPFEGFGKKLLLLDCVSSWKPQAQLVFAGPKTLRLSCCY